MNKNHKTEIAIWFSFILHFFAMNWFRFTNLFLSVIAILLVSISAVEINSKKREQFVKLFNGGGGRSVSSSSSSEEDFPLHKFNLNGIVEFFQHFTGSKRCGKLGRRILKDTHRLFDPAAGHGHGHRSRRHISHHLSELYSRYADCCDDWMTLNPPGPELREGYVLGWRTENRQIQ